MERELKRLLAGTEAEQDLLGLLTAAGGGLTTADIAELTESEPWQIDEHLHTVAGRSFTRRGARWQVGIDVYLLGHEELQATAEKYLGHRLSAYRERLHAWAASYRPRRWPPGTPE